MKPILVPYDENMTKEELLKAIADAAGSDVETVKKELCEPKTEPQTMDMLAIDMAVAKCKAQHNNCKNCDKKCIWRGKP